MQSNLQNNLKKIKYQPSISLQKNILKELISIQENQVNLRIIFLYSIGFIALVATIPAFKLLFSDLKQSGFFEYIYIGIFYSGSLLYWKELSMSILESLPITSIILSFSLSFIFLISIKYAVKQINKPDFLNSHSKIGKLSLSF